MRRAIRGVVSLAMMAALVLPAMARAEGLNTISAIKFQRTGSERQIRIVGSTQPTFQRFSLANPPRLVLDFVASRISGVPGTTEVGDAVVERIAAEQQGIDGTSLSRVMIAFKRQVDFAISTDGNDVVIAIQGGAGAGGDVSTQVAASTATVAPAAEPTAAPAAAPAKSETDSSVAVASGPRNMTLCGFRFMSNVSRVFVRTNYKAEFSVNKMGDKKVVVELPNTNIPLRNNRNFLDAQYFASPVKLITPMVGGGGITRIEIELKNDVPFQSRQVENEIQIDFPNGG